MSEERNTDKDVLINRASELTRKAFWVIHGDGWSADLSQDKSVMLGSQAMVTMRGTCRDSETNVTRAIHAVTTFSYNNDGWKASKTEAIVQIDDTKECQCILDIIDGQMIPRAPQFRPISIPVTRGARA